MRETSLADPAYRYQSRREIDVLAPLLCSSGVSGYLIFLQLDVLWE